MCKLWWQEEDGVERRGNYNSDGKLIFLFLTDGEFAAFADVDRFNRGAMPIEMPLVESGFSKDEVNYMDVISLEEAMFYVNKIKTKADWIPPAKIASFGGLNF